MTVTSLMPPSLCNLSDARHAIVLGSVKKTSSDIYGQKTAIHPAYIGMLGPCFIRDGNHVFFIRVTHHGEGITMISWYHVVPGVGTIPNITVCVISLIVWSHVISSWADQHPTCLFQLTQVYLGSVRTKVGSMYTLNGSTNVPR